jgi:hypothetical protein
MSLDIRYSDSLKEDEGHYHDFRYTNDQYGGNQNETTLTIDNICGNDIEIEFESESDGKEYLCIVKKVKVRIKGGVENGDFLRALQTILEAEKISELLGR